VPATAMLTPEMRERVAQAIHETYRRDQAGRKGADDPAMAEWRDLDEGLKESNRHQADQILDLLHITGWQVQPALTQAPPVTLDADDVEDMAELVHARWVEGREQSGWKPGPERDVANRASPYLVPWSELPEEIREYDRETVRAIPAILAQVGLELRRPN
jgi:hypothetical protein